MTRYIFNPFTKRLDAVDLGSSPSGPIETLSGEHGANTAPSGGNFNFSGSTAGGAGSNGAIIFSTPANGEMDAKVQVDNVTIGINASNQLYTIGDLNGTATTVGATTANINVSIPIPTNSASSLIVNVVAYDAINMHCVGGESIGLVRNDGGVLTVVGTSDVTRNNDNVLSAWMVAIVAVGTNAFIQVTGVGGTTLQWRAIIEVCNAP